MLNLISTATFNGIAQASVMLSRYFHIYRPCICSGLKGLMMEETGVPRKTTD